MNLLELPFTAVRLVFGLGAEVVSRARDVVEAVVPGLDGSRELDDDARFWPEDAGNGRDPVAEARVAVERDPVAEPEQAGAAAPDASPASAFEATVPPPRPAPPVEEHVDEEVVPVAEFAEPGAEDGAGAQLSVDEPWEGYDAMRVPEVRSRLTDADPALLAAVRLYESTHKGRRSVLDAVDRRLKG